MKVASIRADVSNWPSCLDLHDLVIQALEEHRRELVDGTRRYGGKDLAEHYFVHVCFTELKFVRIIEEIRHMNPVREVPRTGAMAFCTSV